MYDPNATIYSDPNATLIGQQPQQHYDPNATLIGHAPPQHYDPNATLIGHAPPQHYDPNATLIGQSGPVSGDPNATLIGSAGPVFVNHSAFVAQQATPQIVPHIKLTPHNSHFQVVEHDVLRTLKFGRRGEVAEAELDPDFIWYDSRVVSRRHAEIWAVNGEFYIRDTKSQSGTFLNAMRLSLPGEESKPFKLKNGDTIQFGVDRKGGTTADTKCVSVVCELSFKKSVPQQRGFPQPGYAPQGYPQPASPQAHTPGARPLSNLSDLTLVGQRH